MWRAIVYVAAGLAAPLLWTPLESWLFVALPLATSRSMFSGYQIFVGLASAVVLALPLTMAVPPPSAYFGLLFVGAFLTSQIALHLAFGGTTETLLLLFQLPDTWAFLITCLGVVWWAASRQAVRNAA